MGIDWSDYGLYNDKQMPTDWLHVTSINPGMGYEWTTLHAFWSPSARRYFWASGSGCSCNSWSDDLRTEADFENGDRDALRRGIRRFVEGHSYSISGVDALDALDEVARFKEDCPPGWPGEVKS